VILTPTNVIKGRLARNWCKMQSTRQWDYRVSDGAVINNKPHIVLKSVPMMPAYQPQQPSFMTLGSLMAGLHLPDGGEDEEVESND
jgi:hypothetical protein